MAPSPRTSKPEESVPRAVIWRSLDQPLRRLHRDEGAVVGVPGAVEVLPPLPHEHPVPLPDAPRPRRGPPEVVRRDRLVRPLVAQVDPDRRPEAVLQGELRGVLPFPVEVARRPRSASPRATTRPPRTGCPRWASPLPPLAAPPACTAPRRGAGGGSGRRPRRWASAGARPGPAGVPPSPPGCAPRPGPAGHVGQHRRRSSSCSFLNGLAGPCQGSGNALAGLSVLASQAAQAARC